MATHNVGASSEQAAPGKTEQRDLEATVAAAMAEILGVDRVSSEDDFLALGADSLNAVELAALIEEQSGAAIEPADVYRFPTPRLLSHEINRRRRDAPDTAAARSNLSDILRGDIPRIEDAESYSLSPIQRRWAIDYLADRTKTWGNLSLRLILPDRGDAAALGAAVSAVWAAHEALRTVFRVEDGGDVRQVILSTAEVPVIEHDFSELSGEDRAMRTAQVARSEAKTVFDLAEAPAARVALVRGSDSSEAILTIHHMLADGWSLMTLREQLLCAYGEAVKGRTPSIEAPKVRYRDYAAWMNGLEAQGLLSDARRYWLGELDGDLPSTMPTDDALARSSDASGASLLIVLPSDLVTSVRELAVTTRFSVSALLFGALFSALHDRTHARDLIVGTPLAGRDRQDIRNVIGMFINLVPIRLRLQRGWNFENVVAATHDKLLGAVTNQRYQLDDIVRDLEIEREAHRFPITNTFFTKIAMGQQTIGPQTGVSTASELPIDVRYQTMLYAYDFADGLVLDCRYRKILFGADEISALMDRYIAILRNAVA